MTLDPPGPENTRKGKGTTKRFKPAAEAASSRPKSKKKRPAQGNCSVSDPPEYKKKGRPRKEGVTPSLTNLNLSGLKARAFELGIKKAPTKFRNHKQSWIDLIRAEQSKPSQTG